MTKTKANPTDTPSWWMIERSDLEPSPHYFAWKYRPGELPETAPHGSHTWTPDWTLGERFPTKEAAEEHTNGDPLLHVVEHCMMQANTHSIDEELIERLCDIAQELLNDDMPIDANHVKHAADRLESLLSDRAKLKERVREAMTWIEAPFVMPDTSADELRKRIGFMLEDIEKALNRSTDR